MAKAKSQKPNWISIGEAAKYLGISRDTLRRWEKKGMIKPNRSPTNRRYYTQSLLDEAMEKKQSRQKSLKIKIEKKNLGIPILAGLITLTATFALAWIIFLK